MRHILASVTMSTCVSCGWRERRSMHRTTHRNGTNTHLATRSVGCARDEMTPCSELLNRKTVGIGCDAVNCRPWTFEDGGNTPGWVSQYACMHACMSGGVAVLTLNSAHVFEGGPFGLEP
jgi:hypothetical protein